MLRPQVLNFNWLQFSDAEEIIEIGFRDASENLNEIRKKVGLPEPQKTFFEKFMDFLFNF
ncbi:hypothetical protein HY227_02605 [Candidatus Wolfebacteria bacterium]|nr:hypothetical protein [Candidatus Wolfebacteria bacterium]